MAASRWFETARSGQRRRHPHGVEARYHYHRARFTLEALFAASQRLEYAM